MTILFLAGADLDVAGGDEIFLVTVAPPWLLKPMTIPDLTGAALDSGSALVSPV